MTSTITKRFGPYPFAHRQPLHDGHCRHIHGHNWHFDVTLSADCLDATGFIYDFGKMDNLKAYLTALFDHTLLLEENDPAYDELVRFPAYFQIRRVPCGAASTEGLARYLCRELQGLLWRDDYARGRNVQVIAVRVEEDGKNSAIFLA